jgi:hypothetical protein
MQPVATRFKNTCRNCNIVFYTNGYFCKYCKPCNKSLAIEQDLRIRKLQSEARDNFRTPYNKHKKLLPSILTYGHSGNYQNIWCNSTYELAFVITNVMENQPITKCTHSIYYMHEKKGARYTPDYQINNDIYVIAPNPTEKQRSQEKSADERGLRITFLKGKEMDYYFQYVYTKTNHDPRTHHQFFYTGKDPIATPAPKPRTDAPKPSIYHILDKIKDPTEQRQLFRTHYPATNDKEMLQKKIDSLMKQDGTCGRLQEIMDFLYNS